MGGGVVVGDGAVHLDGVLDVGVRKQGVVLVVVLVRDDGLLEIVPDSLAVLVTVLHALEEAGQALGGEVAVGVHEQGRDDRGDVLAAHQVLELFLADVDTRGIRVLDEQVFVDEALPHRVANLLLLLLAGGGSAGKHLIDAGILVDLLLEVGVAHGLTIDLAHIVLGRDGLDRLDDLARIDDEQEEREGNQDGKDDAPTAKFL